MTTSIPREVNGKWYPVPCPEFIPIGKDFPSYEACLAACETSESAGEGLEQFEMTFGTVHPDEIVQNHEAELEATDEAAFQRGYDEHGLNECDEMDCVCFERGIEYAKAQKPA
jgi:hypothetical protein